MVNRKDLDKKYALISVFDKKELRYLCNNLTIQIIMKKSVINNNDIARDSKRSALIVSFYVLVLISGVIISVI